MKYLNLYCRTATMIALAAAAVLAQTPAAAPAFEVAVIKPSVVPTQLNGANLANLRIGVTINQSRVTIGLTPLRQIIATAYNVKPYQVTGPDWLANTPFDIEARLPDGATEDQVPQMLQALLADRFKMVARKENREQPIYALVVGKGGLKMQEKAAEPDAPPPPGTTTIGTGQNQMRITQNGGRGGTLAAQGMKISFGDNGVHIEMTELAKLVDLLTQVLGKTVVDKTNLKGTYDIQLDLQPEGLVGARGGGAIAFGGGGAGVPPGAGIATASDPGGDSSAFLKTVEKLGLKLESQKDQIETIVVDRIEKTPTEN